mgnify:CR=1 FL=1
MIMPFPAFKAASFRPFFSIVRSKIEYQGITHFDLANNYGPEPGSAEINFGRIFRDNLKNSKMRMPYRRKLEAEGFWFSIGFLLFFIFIFKMQSIFFR